MPTIQRMEASDGVIRGNVDSLTKLIAALDTVGIELIGENAVSQGGGRGVRLKATMTLRTNCTHKSNEAVPMQAAE